MLTKLASKLKTPMGDGKGLWRVRAGKWQRRKSGVSGDPTTRVDSGEASEGWSAKQDSFEGGGRQWKRTGK